MAEKTPPFDAAEAYAFYTLIDLRPPAQRLGAACNMLAAAAAWLAISDGPAAAAAALYSFADEKLGGLVPHPFRGRAGARDRLDRRTAK